MVNEHYLFILFKLVRLIVHVFDTLLERSLVQIYVLKVIVWSPQVDISAGWVYELAFTNSSISYKLDDFSPVEQYFSDYFCQN